MKKTGQSINELILLSMQSILHTKKKCSFGDIINECFKTYPEIFSLADYPKYPDSLKLDRPLRELRNDGLIKGNPVTFYSITFVGREYLDKIKVKTANIPTVNRTRSPLIINLNEIEESEDFRQYRYATNNYTPNNMRIRFLTKYTLEASPKIVKRHLSQLLKIALSSNKEELSNFIKLYISFFSTN